ncbi:hypothetical protein [Methylobacterium oryzisoli]|uniref:hypothetical protein n=1 Tax=Methylobacterium oryzisoli TaxID=3385502 RepID=UPI003891A4BF
MPPETSQSNVIVFPAQPLAAGSVALRRQEIARDIAQLKELAIQLDAARVELPDAAAAFDLTIMAACGKDPIMRDLGLERQAGALAMGIQELIRIMSDQHSEL